MSAASKFMPASSIHWQSPLVAQTIDVEIARIRRRHLRRQSTGFTYTRNFHTAKDELRRYATLCFSDNRERKRSSQWKSHYGVQVVEFYVPDNCQQRCRHPTAGDTPVIADFVNATGGTTVSFGGTAPPITASGQSYAKWGDPANLTGWSVPWTILSPTPVQLATTAQGYSNGSPNGTITITVPLGTKAVTVNMSTVAGSGTLVYQVSRSGLIVTVTPEDITTSAGQTAVTTSLISGTKVEVDGVPQPDGTIKAYVVIYYTGVKPTAVD